MDRGKDGTDHRTGHGDLGELEGDGTGVADNAAPILINLSCKLVNDQSAMASGSSIQRKKMFQRKRHDFNSNVNFSENRPEL